jgi:uncharacterized membrane protein YbhN (UPF0104 family)
MSNVMGAARRALYRRPGWRWLAAAISLAIVAIAGMTLYRVFHEVELARVIDTLKTQSTQHLLLSCLFVGAGYLTLTCYDVFALRAIGRGHLPYRVAALASFTSYTIGHTLGAATLTGGVVRHRIYSVWGLSVLDVAKIAFITGMTFWLGTAFVLGGAMTYAPDVAGAVDHLPGWVNRLIGLSCLLAIACYLGWLLPRPRTIGYANWKLALPNVRFTLVQIAIGAMDLSLVTLALYTLLPVTPPVDFIGVLIIFVTATFLGTISHVPGNLGIIEAALLVGLPQFPKEDLLAALLTFRILYFIIPVCLAMLVLGLRELRLVARPTTTSQRS